MFNKNSDKNSDKNSEILKLALKFEEGLIPKERIRSSIIKIYRPKPTNPFVNEVEYERDIDRILLDLLEKASNSTTNDTKKKSFLKMAELVYQQGLLPQPPNEINDHELTHFDLNKKTIIDFHKHAPLSVEFFLKHLMKQYFFKDIIPLFIHFGPGNHTPQDKRNSEGKIPLCVAVEKCFKEQHIPFDIDIKSGTIFIKKLPKNWKFSESIAEQKDEWTTITRSKSVRQKDLDINFSYAENPFLLLSPKSISNDDVITQKNIAPNIDHFSSQKNTLIRKKK